MPEKRTCFVVSRIGEEGGPIRKHADDVFGLLIQPALEKYGIEAVRADHIAGTGSITKDVIKYVQDSDLCIIDLTGKNPNVYYECGRRHEIGKPFIQIISKEEDIPFDIADIRTIKYELTDPWEVRNAAVKIQAFVDEAMTQGFTSTSGATSMSSLLEAINRIERRLANMENQSGGSIRTNVASGDFRTLTDNPLRTFQEAYTRGDLATIVALLPRLESLMPPGNFVMAAGVVALQGEEVGAAALRRILDGKLDRLDTKEMKSAITALVQFHVARSDEVGGVEFLQQVIEKSLLRADLSGEDMAYLTNQLGMILHGAEKYEPALHATERAISFNPKEGSYHYNISIIYEKLGMQGKAIQHIKDSLQLDTEPDLDHMAHAYEIFSKASMYDDASSVLSAIAKIDPSRAAYLQSTGRRQRR